MTPIKLIIFSDSHGNTDKMRQIVEREAPDEIIHLGDLLRDAKELARAFPRIPAAMVPGNCDGWTDEKDCLLLKREKTKILLAHGHQWQVKSTGALALRQARARGAQVLLYGHTHRAVCRREGSVLILNPGTVGGVGARATYGVLRLEGAAVEPQVLPVE